MQSFFSVLSFLRIYRFSLVPLFFAVASFLSGCFYSGDDVYSYVVLKGAIQRENPEDMIDVVADSRCTLLSNDMDGDAYEVSIGAKENCNVLWTINNEVVQRAVIAKSWDTKDHVLGLNIEVTDERSKNTRTVYSETPDSREWIIELNQ